MLRMAVHNLTQLAGVKSEVIQLLVNHLRGAITILPGLEFNQAPHQLKELLAMILC